MSKSIDERIVSMQFNNKDFEKNAATTLSTLEKLKQKLNFTGAAKGLDNISAATNKVNMNGLGTAVDTISAKFSALDVMGVTALANITNSAVNAGKRIVSSLTIDPIKSGFNEYELKMGSIQTIMAGTGESLEKVNQYLDELNTYSDKTIYSFQDMTSNIGKFTNAGVKLEDAVLAIKGISNEAAVSGANANEASRAMYNFAQALSAGYVKLIDWKSIELANMATVEFKNQLLESAVAAGTLTKASDGMYKTLKGNTLNATKNFNETLTDQWMTTEVLVGTLKDYADETTEIGKKAYASAQDVKTFSMMMDTLKETAQSGWAKTWEIIFGDYEQSKNMWTGLTNTIGGVIDAMSDARNNLLEGAFSSRWDMLNKKIGEAGVSTEEFQKKLKETAKENGVSVDDLIKKYGSLGKAFESGKLSTNLVTKTLKSMASEQTKTATATEDMTEKLKCFQKVVDEVWNGDFKNDKERVDELTKAGYKYSEVQNLVNKTVDGRRLTLEDLSVTQLKAVGYTEKEIEAISKLAKEAEKAGTPLNQLIDDLNKPSGRELFGKSFTNMFQPILTIINSIKEAWSDAFPPMESSSLYRIIEGLHTFSTYLVISEDAAKDLTRTLKGVFAILDMVTMVFNGGFRVAFGIASKILSEFWKALGFANVNILKVTASIGDAIVAVRNWIDEHSLINKTIELLVPLLVSLGKAVVTFVKSIGEIPAVKKGIESVAKAFSDIGKAINDFVGAPIESLEKFIDILKNMEDVSFEGIGKAFKEAFGIDLSSLPGDMIDGFVNGLSSVGGKAVNALMKLGTLLLEAIKGVLGIHSPSIETHEVGVNFVEGFINGIGSMFSKVFEVIGGFASKCIELLSNINWGSVFAGGISIGMLLVIKQFASAINKLSAPMEGLGELFSGAGEVLQHSAKGIGKILKNTAKVVKSFSKVLSSFAFSIKAKALKDIATALLMLVGAIVVLSFIDPAKLWQSVAIVTVLSGVLVALAFAADKMSSAGASIGKDGVKVGGFKSGLLAIAASLLILGVTVKLMGSMNMGQAIQGFVGLGVLVLAIAGVLAAYGMLVKGKSAQNIDKAGKMIRKMATTLLLMVVVVKLAGMLSIGEMVKGTIFLAGFTAFVAGLVFVTKTAGRSVDKVGSMLLKLSASLLLLVGVVKLVGMLSVGEMIKGGIFIAGFTVFVAALVGIVKGAGKDIPKIGGILLALSTSILILAGTMKIIAGMSPGDIAKGVIAIGLLGTVIGALVLIVGKMGGKAPRIAATLLAMSVSIGILAAVSVMLSLVDLRGLAKGVVAITMLGTVMTAMIWATRGAKDVKSNLIVMTVAIGIMAAAVAALSFIDPARLAIASGSLALLMSMFSLITKMSSSIKSSIAPLIIMTTAVGMLAGILYLLSGLQVENVLAVSASLSTLLMAFSGAMLILSKAGVVAPTALIAIGIMTLVVTALAGILYLLSGIEAESMLPTVTALSTLLLAMSGVCVILAAVGATGPAAFIGIGALVTLIGGVGALMVAIGALVTYIPAMEEFLDKGIVVLQKIGYGLGSFVGNIVAGFTESVLSGLPTIGTQLSAFMQNIQPFIAGAKQIDPSMMEGVKALAGAMLILTGAKLLDSLTSWLTGGTSLADFGAELAKFGPYMKQYADSVAGIDSETVVASANAAKALSEMASNLPKEGGLFEFFTGKNSLTDFGNNLITFGASLKEYSLNVAGMDVESVNASATAAKGLVELANAIPNMGGLVSFLTGDNNIGDFGTQLKTFGAGLKNYAAEVTGLNITAITDSAKAAEGLVKLADVIPNDGGVWGWLVGDNSVADFGDKLVPLGKGLAAYSNEVANVSQEKITNSVSTIRSLTSMIDDMKNIDTGGVNLFTSAVNKLSKTNMDGLVKAFSGDASKLAAAGKSMATNISSGLLSKKSSVTSAITEIINSAVKKVNSKQSDFKTAGIKLISELISGMDKNASKAQSSISKTLKTVVDKIRSYYSDFYNAGVHVVNGFANGISSNTWKASAKAKAMARAAKKAAEKELDEHSPSKEFYNIGDFAGKGFVNALSDYGKKSYSAGASMANSARKGLSKAIGNISNIVNLDIDSQPTIRPVLDLSNISSGARDINGMLDINPSVGIMARINSISSMMNGNQNGVNDDVVSAINRLRKDLGNIGGGQSISIGGITYDNGSSVYKAVEALIRAAKIEGRV